MKEEEKSRCEVKKKKRRGLQKKSKCKKRSKGEEQMYGKRKSR